jgi:hypothetical protein
MAAVRNYEAGATFAPFYVHWAHYNCKNMRTVTKPRSSEGEIVLSMRIAVCPTYYCRKKH